MHAASRGIVLIIPFVQMWIGITLGGILIAFLMAFKVKSAIIIGISIVSILSWPFVNLFPFA